MTKRLKSRARPTRRLKATVICGLLAGSSVAIADEPGMPDMAFLEYLGSWDESDEDWVLFAEGEGGDEETASDEKSNGAEPAPADAKVAEVDDEN